MAYAPRTDGCGKDDMPTGSAEEQLTILKAQMFTAIRDFFVSLTGLIEMVKPAVQAQLDADRRQR